MATPTNWETQMEQYLNRQMSDEESRRFETEINNDPQKLKALQDRMQAELAVVLTAREAEVTALKSRYSSGNAPVRNFNYGYLAIAATVLVLIGFAILFRPKAEFDPQAVFAANYVVPAAPQARGDNGLDSLYQEANQFYNLKRYEEAIPRYIEYLNVDIDSLSPTDYHNARLYLTISLLETNKLDEAISHLNLIMEKDEHAQWYLALALLKQKKIGESQQVLSRIAGQERHLYQEKAAKLLALFP